MHAELRVLRAPVVFDGRRFLPGGATVLVDADTTENGIEAPDDVLEQVASRDVVLDLTPSVSTGPGSPPCPDPLRTSRGRWRDGLG